MMKKILLAIFWVCIFFSGFGLQTYKADAAIQFVGSSTASGNSADYNVSLTALTGGIASKVERGDIVIVATSFASSTNQNPGVTNTGYLEMLDAFSSDTNSINTSINYKIMNDTPDTTVTCKGSTSATFSSTCLALVFRGVNPITPMDVASTTVITSNESNEDINCPSITPVTQGAVVVCTGGAVGSAAASSITWPANYIFTMSTQDPGTATASVGGFRFWTSGAENPAAFAMSMGTASQNTWIALTLALRPLPEARKMRLFQGYKINIVEGGKIKVLQQ